MSKQQLLVSVNDGTVTLTLELGPLTINVPGVHLTIPRIGGGDVHNHVALSTGKQPFARFLRPGIFSAAGFVTCLGMWRLLH